jgi:pathogenesis-related protein 1
LVAAITGITSLSAGPVAGAPEQQTTQQTAKGLQLPPRDSTQKSDPNISITNSASIGSDLSLQEVRQLIDLHNRVRADAGAGPLSWYRELAIYAQEWADHLASKGCKMEHRPHSGKWKQKYGENLFMGTSGYYGVADAVTAWESEKKYYKGEALNSSNWYASGHYTQVIWKNTQRVGCARAECNNGMMIVVCNYDPPGNVIGQRP